MLYVTKETIYSVANQITCNSVIFGDEVAGVAFDLMLLVADAETFGCNFTRSIKDYWGGEDEVTAIPSPANVRHHWEF